MFEIALVGFGAIGQELAKTLLTDPEARIVQIVVPEETVAVTCEAAARLAPYARVLTALDLEARPRLGLVAECAGHEAVMQHVAPALRAGVDCLVASVGALCDPTRLAILEGVTRDGRSRLQLISGAVGGIDALSAARAAGLERVVYVGRKPPAGWTGTAAEEVCDLAALAAPTVIFRGNARDAARLFPKNANVAATVALAGVGFDRTEVELVADPGVTRNVHSIEAAGAFGSLAVKLENDPLSENPKTSALAFYSLARRVRDNWSRVVI